MEGSLARTLLADSEDIEVLWYSSVREDWRDSDLVQRPSQASLSSGERRRRTLGLLYKDAALLPAGIWAVPGSRKDLGNSGEGIPPSLVKGRW